MLNSFISWFDSLPITAILSVAIILLIMELLIVKIVPGAPRLKKWLLINIWQIFGVLLPVIWLLRTVEGYIEVIPLVIMIVFFGVYKPILMKKNSML